MRKEVSPFFTVEETNVLKNKINITVLILKFIAQTKIKKLSLSKRMDATMSSLFTTNKDAMSLTLIQ